MNLNKVFLIGRLVADPELQHTSNGTPFSRIRVAVNNPYKDKNREWKEDPVFIDVVLWGNLADWTVSRFNKGDRVLVEGSLRQSTWKTESGENRSKIEIRADKFSPLDARKEETTEEEPPDDIEF
ncbi:single-strand binding protein [Balnearium lithotrophicum]|uniref:Single-stranded DNA-binding protein n=1 Tax=Balnearium lithotrophicum TaxID=223788 RepID=A0A521CQV1_9BACT|nr:single-stranded DNA-binding protein [Balnearium lithotrophicum]SMO61141.1 single-strand binding protein [Balnearium lithotrophicum]